MRGTSIALTIMLLTALVVGCGPAEKQPVTLPPLSTTSSPSTTMSATASAFGTPSSTASPTASGDEAAVEALYLDWMAHLNTSQHMSKTARRAYLSRWMTDPALTQYNEAIQAQQDRHAVAGGKRVPHVLSVRVEGTRAVLKDCNDLSRITVKDSRTGRKINQPQKWLSYRATFEQTADGWRISRADPTVAKSYAKCLKQNDATPSPS